MLATSFLFYAGAGRLVNAQLLYMIVGYKMKKYNKQVVRTREWTFQALLLLLEKQPYEEITISQIAQKAGIARQTFYRHYRTKDDVISFYLDSMILALQEMFANLKEDDPKAIYQLIFSSFLEHEPQLKVIKTIGRDHLILNRLWDHNQHFLEDLAQANRLTEMERLTVGYQLGGLLHVVLGWLEGTDRLSPDQMARFFCDLQTVSDKKLELARLLHHPSLDNGKK